MSTYSIDSSDVTSATRNLNHLLSVICDMRFERAVGQDDERIDSLLWVARDLSDGIVNHIDAEADRRLAATAEAQS